MHKFDLGSAFPRLQGFSVAHDMITLPDDVPEGQYAVILAYRAHW